MPLKTKYIRCIIKQENISRKDKENWEEAKSGIRKIGKGEDQQEVTTTYSKKKVKNEATVKRKFKKKLYIYIHITGH